MSALPSGRRRGGDLRGGRLHSAAVAQLADVHRGDLEVRLLRDRIPARPRQLVGGARAIVGLPVPVAVVERDEDDALPDGRHAYAALYLAAARPDRDEIALADG